MITRSYKSKLKSVLRLYRDFRSTFEVTGRPVSRDTESLYRKLHSPFSIAVISDRPGGSESFINACTGKEILPGDACTSAAIRIRSGKSYSYEAKTAGGRHLEGSGWKNVHEFLVQGVIVPGRYRYLPAACINDLLIKKQGAVTDGDIAKTENALFRDSGSKESARLRFLVGQYIKRFRSQWEKIVTEITFTVPLSEEFSSIAITDCPMIPAECNEGNTTIKPADDAGAIIYVKSLDMKLPESECLNALPALQNKDNVFLVFTGRAALSAGEFEDLKHKAIDTWSKAIPEERIFFADCRAQRLICSLEECTAETIDGCLDEWSQEGKKFKAAESIWCSVNRNADLFREKMEKLAGFNKIHAALGKFIRNAMNKQLAEFLNSMILDCSKFTALKSKETEDLQTLAFKITKMTDEREYAEEALKFKGTYDLIHSYFGKWRSGGIILHQLNNLVFKYINSLNNNEPVTGKLESIRFAMINDRQICHFNFIPNAYGEYDIESIDSEFPHEASSSEEFWELPDFDEPHSAELQPHRIPVNPYSVPSNSAPPIIDQYEIYEPSPDRGYASLQITYNRTFFQYNEMNCLINLLQNFTNKCREQYFKILKMHADDLSNEIQKLTKALAAERTRTENTAALRKKYELIEKIREKLQKKEAEISPLSGTE